MSIEEVWRPVPGFVGLYEVSSLGRVRTLGRWRSNGSGGYQSKPRVLKSHAHKSGHLSVGCYPESGPRRKHLVHRLVLTVFVGPAPDGHECCHRDGNPTNNHVANLYWGTRSQNIRDAYRHGAMRGRNAGVTHCIRGHEFTPENTYTTPTTGSRKCQTCQRDRHRQRSIKRKIERAIDRSSAA